MSTQSPPNTLMIVHPTPWIEGMNARLKGAYYEIWDEEIHAEGNETQGLFRRGQIEVGWVKDPKIEGLAESLVHSHPPFEESEQILVAQHQVSWRLFSENPTVEEATFLIRLAAAMTATQSVATLIPSTTRAFPPAFTRQLSASDGIETIVSLFVHAWNNETHMRTRGLTAFGFPEIEIDIHNGKNEAYFDLLDLSASFILDGLPSFLRPIDLGRSQYTLAHKTDPLPDPESPIAGFFGVISLERK